MAIHRRYPVKGFGSVSFIKVVLATVTNQPEAGVQCSSPRRDGTIHTTGLACRQ